MIDDLLDLPVIQPRAMAWSQLHSVRFVDTLFARQAQIIDAAIHSQTVINEANRRKQYANYT